MGTMTELPAQAGTRHLEGSTLRIRAPHTFWLAISLLWGVEVEVGKESFYFSEPNAVGFLAEEKGKDFQGKGEKIGRWAFLIIYPLRILSFMIHPKSSTPEEEGNREGGNGTCLKITGPPHPKTVSLARKRSITREQHKLSGNVSQHCSISKDIPIRISHGPELDTGRCKGCQILGLTSPGPISGTSLGGISNYRAVFCGSQGSPGSVLEKPRGFQNQLCSLPFSLPSGQNPGLHGQISLFTPSPWLQQPEHLRTLLCPILGILQSCGQPGPMVAIFNYGSRLACSFALKWFLNPSPVWSFSPENPHRKCWRFSFECRRLRASK